MLRLDDLIGKSVVLSHLSGGAYKVTLHGVETGGIWVESADLEKMLAGSFDVSEMPVFFVPYSQMRLLISSQIVL